MKQIIYGMVNFKDKATGEYLTFPTLKGDKGDTGKTAYQSAVELGFTGTEAEWLESLKYTSSPEYDTLLAELRKNEENADKSATDAAASAAEAKSYYDAISGLKGFEIVVLEEGEYNSDGVPTIAEPKDSTFYFVPSGNGGNNNYNEYIYVNGKWEMVGAKEVDLTPYALSSELENYVQTSVLDDYVQTSTLDDYATVASLDDYAKSSDLDDYAKSTDLDDYAKSSDLDNYVQTSVLEDYATVASLDDYATTASLSDYVQTSALDAYTTTTDLAKDYALKTELPTADEKTAWNAKFDLPTTGITEEQLSTEVRVKLNSFFEADPVDKDLLSAYAMKTELLDYATKASLADYAKSEDLDDYAKTADLDDYAKSADLDNYVQATTLANYATVSSLDAYAKAEDLDDYVKSETLDNYVQTSVLDGYVQTSALDDYATTAALDDYALKSELSTAEQRAAWSAKYDKPEAGIPETDLTQELQDKINTPQIEIDDTLTQAETAADAKAAGDAIATKMDAVKEVEFVKWENVEEGTAVTVTTNMVVLTEDAYEKLAVKMPNTFYFIYDSNEGEAINYDL